MSETIRLRFAPSPTGHLHIGNARTAILNWLFARHTRGIFVLRIEDTDQERSTAESEQSILQDLRWLGLYWDEGPDIGGPFGPYRQSERLHLYQEFAQKLIDSGHAYPCYCTAEELEERRKKAFADGGQPMYDGRCRHLTAAQKQKFAQEGRKAAVRFLVPEHPFQFTDLVKGNLTFPVGSFGDFIILRVDGLPTYNFAVAVDDGLMQITHVVRGDDHVSNTPKQLAIYEALQLPIPAFCHIPMILGEDRTRLSKRHGATSIDMYAKHGYLPPALINYLSLLSWSSESGDEILSIDRLINEFDLSRISKSPAIFDVAKLNWMNGVYIRGLEIPELTDLCLPYLRKAGYKLPNRQYLEKMISVVHESLERLEAVIAKTDFFFNEHNQPENNEAATIVAKEYTQKVFWSFIRQLNRIENLDAENFRRIMKIVGQETGVIGKELWMPVRVALTGQLHGPELPLIAEIFGKERCKKLIETWIVE